MISVKFYPKTNKKEEQNRLIKKLLMGIIEFLNLVMVHVIFSEHKHDNAEVAYCINV